MAVIPATEEDHLLGIYEGLLSPTRWHMRITVVKSARGKLVLLLLCSVVAVQIRTGLNGVCV